MVTDAVLEAGRILGFFPLPPSQEAQGKKVKETELSNLEERQYLGAVKTLNIYSDFQGRVQRERSVERGAEGRVSPLGAARGSPMTKLIPSGF